MSVMLPLLRYQKKLWNKSALSVRDGYCKSGGSNDEITTITGFRFHIDHHLLLFEMLLSATIPSCVKPAPLQVG